MLHKDSIVQLTHDLQPGHDALVKKGMAGRVVSTITLHRACIVEFTVNKDQTVVARVNDDDLVEVLPNARV